MSSNTEQIKERLDIVSVVSSYIKLEKAGANFKARCPFHTERTPSFIVSPSRNTYHCFGCGRGGDIFSFVQEIEGGDFKDALKTLAERAGVALSDGNPKERGERTALFDVLAHASSFYQAVLKTRPDVLEYLSERGVAPETIDTFSIGYAPSGWESLRQALSKRGFGDPLLLKAGLLIQGNKGPYDRFRGRVMFPIRNPAGKVVGFSGRIFEESGRNDVAKYINTPATPLYDKSNILYGFDTAKTEIRKENACIVVEGQMDVVLSQQAGVRHTVAASGTALTASHLEIIRRLTDRVLFAFDADEAGLSAAERSASLALALGMEVLAVPLPKGTDPADIAKESPERLRKVVAEARPLIDFYLSMILEGELDKDARQKAIERRVLPAIAETANQIDRARYVRRVAEVLEVPEEAVVYEVRRRERSASTSTVHGSEAAFPRQKISSPRKTRNEAVLERLFGIIFWQESLPKPAVNAANVRAAYEDIVGRERAEETESLFDEDRRRSLAARAEISAPPEGLLSKEIQELLFALEIETLNERIKKLHAEIELCAGNEREAECLRTILELQQKKEALIKRA